MADPKYGKGDATHHALGGVRGIRRLVEAFYREMDTRPEARVVRAMHPPDLGESIERLTAFLSGWTGGPRLYAERYGTISIPGFHQHLPIGEPERDAWLSCMRRAAHAVALDDDLAEYLLAALFVPAERIREVASDRRERAGA